MYGLRPHWTVIIHDYVLCYALSLLLNLAVICHTNDTCAISCIMEGFL